MAKRRIFKGISEVVRRFLFPGVFGRPVEKPRVFVEMLPREFGNAVGKLGVAVPTADTACDDARGYKSVDCAIAECKKAGLALFPHVRPENLLFVFSERMELLELFVTDHLCFYGFSDSVDEYRATMHHHQSYPCREDCQSNRAIVACRLIGTDEARRFVQDGEEDCATDGDCRIMSWLEILQRFEQSS